MKVPGWGLGAGRRVLLPVGLFASSEKNVFVSADRVHPVYFRYPYVKSDDIAITFPSGWKVSDMPNSISQDSAPLAYFHKAEVKNGVLHVGRTLRVNLEMVLKNQYQVLRQFFQMVRAQDEQQVVLQTVN